jgi:hypothetical protein
VNWLEQKYIGLVSGRLERFKVLDHSPYKANCRCPFCGDSQSNKLKARGFILPAKGSFTYYCHNCSISLPFGKFLQDLDPTLYKDFMVERFLENQADHVIVAPIVKKDFERPKFTRSEGLRDLKTISQLKWDHPAKQYIVNRKIPNEYHAKLFYAPHFAKFVNSLVPGKLPEDITEPRLIIPFIDKSETMFGFQGRSFKKTGLRYITTMLVDDRPKVFGLDTVDFDRKVYILEGPIDSMFIPNSLAMAGSSLTSIASNDILNPSNCVKVFDNEPRNADIVRLMYKSVAEGFKVCIWPHSIVEKDINAMVLGVHTPEKIKDIIDEHTFSGLMAEAQITHWKKRGDNIYGKVQRTSKAN